MDHVKKKVFVLSILKRFPSQYTRSSNHVVIPELYCRLWKIRRSEVDNYGKSSKIAKGEKKLCYINRTNWILFSWCYLQQLKWWSHFKRCRCSAFIDIDAAFTWMNFRQIWIPAHQSTVFSSKTPTTVDRLWKIYGLQRGLGPINHGNDISHWVSRTLLQRVSFKSRWHHCEVRAHPDSVPGLVRKIGHLRRHTGSHERGDVGRAVCYFQSHQKWRCAKSRMRCI